MPALNDDELPALVDRAKAGDENALEAIILSVQDHVYRLALRMTACPEDARDACQEILVKVVTRLDSFRGESSLRTWVHRIAVSHLLDKKKSRVEQLDLSFERFGAELLDGLSPEGTDDPLMAEEVKLGCTLAMLTCLDRAHRIAYVLADVFDLPPAEAATLTDVSEDTHRQRLSRARRSLEAFTERFCGLVSEDAPCSCNKRIARAEELGRIERGRPKLAERGLEARHEMETLHDTARLMRSHPDYQAPSDMLIGVRSLLGTRTPRILS